MSRISSIQGQPFLTLIAVAGLIVLGGCATPYQKQNMFGGYSDFSQSPSRVSVTFKGNGFTSWDRAREFALRRAAELTIERGMDCFVVEERVDHSKTGEVSTMHGRASGVRGGMSLLGIRRSQSTRKPRISIDIKMYARADAPDNAVDANHFISQNFPQTQ